MFDTFTPFPRLPFELRREIWKFALPINRIILVQEAPLNDEYPDPDAEVEFYRDMQASSDLRHARAKKHPDYIDGRQATFVEGSICVRNGPMTGHFMETDEDGSTGVCLNCKLLDDATRRGRLFTRQPVLSFLQVCHESRELMKDFGYVLTFSSRCAPPLTWFNFDIDILYLRGAVREGELHSHRLDGTVYNLGQFKQADLARVKRIALEVRGHEDFSDYIVPAAKSFQGLEEIWVVLEDVGDLGTTSPKQTRYPLIALECEFLPIPSDRRLQEFHPFSWYYYHPDDLRHAPPSTYLPDSADLIRQRMLGAPPRFWQHEQPKRRQYVEDTSKTPQIKFVVMATPGGERRITEWKRRNCVWAQKNRDLPNADGLQEIEIKFEQFSDCFHLEAHRLALERARMDPEMHYCLCGDYRCVCAGVFEYHTLREGVIMPGDHVQ